MLLVWQACKYFSKVVPKINFPKNAIGHLKHQHNKYALIRRLLSRNLETKIRNQQTTCKTVYQQSAHEYQEPKISFKQKLYSLVR